MADALSSTAARAQAPVLALLEQRGAPHRAYWIANAIWVRGGLALVEELAARDDVVHVYANPRVPLSLPAGPRVRQTGRARHDRMERREGPRARRLGARLRRHGRRRRRRRHRLSMGPSGVEAALPRMERLVADHNYNWHDAIHDSTGNPCGNDSPFPCDDFGHGTHTMGTMVGDDGGAQPDRRGAGREVDRLPQHGRRDRNAGALHRVLPVVHRADGPVRARTPIRRRRPHVINDSWTLPARARAARTRRSSRPSSRA